MFRDVNSARIMSAVGTKSKDIGGPNGATVAVTILTQAEATWATCSPIPTNGPTPPEGTHRAQLFDESGDLLSQAGPTVFVVPLQGSPIVLTIQPDLLSLSLTSATEGAPTYVFGPTFVPTMNSYTSVSPEPESLYNPYTFTLTTVEPNATIEVTDTSTGTTLLAAGSSSGSSCTESLTYSPETFTIVVTSADGTSTQTYAISTLYNGG